MIKLEDLTVAIERQTDLVSWAKDTIKKSEDQLANQAEELRKNEFRIAFLEKSIETLTGYASAEVLEQGKFFLDLEKNRTRGIEQAVASIKEQNEKMLGEIAVDETMLHVLLEKQTEMGAICQ